MEVAIIIMNPHIQQKIHTIIIMVTKLTQPVSCHQTPISANEVETSNKILVLLKTLQLSHLKHDSHDLYFNLMLTCPVLAVSHLALIHRAFISTQ